MHKERKLEPIATINVSSLQDIKNMPNVEQRKWTSVSNWMSTLEELQVVLDRLLQEDREQGLVNVKYAYHSGMLYPSPDSDKRILEGFQLFSTNRAELLLKATMQRGAEKYRAERK